MYDIVITKIISIAFWKEGAEMHKKNRDNSLTNRIKISKYLVLLLVILILGKSMILILDLGAFLSDSLSQVLVLEQNDSVRIQAAIGYIQLSSEYFPIGANLVVSEKMFGSCIIITILIFENIPLILILLKIKDIIQKTETPFCNEVCRKVKQIGWIIVYLGVLQRAIIQISVSSICYHKFWFNNPIDFVKLFVGLIVLLLGDVFLYGYKLQKETDELL